MSLDGYIIAHAIQSKKGLSGLRRAGIGVEHIVGDEARKAWEYIVKMHKEHDTVPSRAVIERRYKNLDLPKVRERDLPSLVGEVKATRRFTRFLDAIEDASREAGSPDDTEWAIATLRAKLNDIEVDSGRATIVDMFTGEARKTLEAKLMERRRGTTIGIPTGFKRFDYVTNGLQRGKMVTVMGRPSLGKSWLNQIFIARAVIAGHKVCLYPLEMPLEEVAIRLYTIFSQAIFGPDKVLRNLDLANGRISKKKIVKFLDYMENHYAGLLHVADIGSMSDPYTIDRIDAEQDVYQFDMTWIDYLTLMKAPGASRDGVDDHHVVRALSNGVKWMAIKHDNVGGCSVQVNREAIKGRAFLPRIEHIAYGDAVGQDSDQVISINRKGPYLYYALVKHRGGPEIGKTRVKFFVDEGVIEETKDQDDEDEDD